MTDNADGYPSIREAWEEFQARRAPRDIVPPKPVDPNAPPLAASLGGDVTYIEIDDDGIPQQKTETGWLAVGPAIGQPKGEEQS